MYVGGIYRPFIALGRQRNGLFGMQLAFFIIEHLHVPRHLLDQVGKFPVGMKGEMPWTVASLEAYESWIRRGQRGGFSKVYVINIYLVRSQVGHVQIAIIWG